MEIDDLTRIVNLVKIECSKSFEAIKENEDLIPIVRSYKNVVTKLEVGLNKHSATSETKIETKPDWNQTIAKIIDEKLITNGTLSSLATSLVRTTSITNKFDNPLGQMEMWLETFFKRLAKDEFEKLYSHGKPKSTTHYVSNLMMELNEIPVTIEFTAKILGVFISCTDAISQHFSFRKLQSHDIDIDNKMSFNFPDGILTFKIKGNQNEGHPKMSNILDVFRLFRLSSVTHQELRSISSSLIWPMSSGTTSPIQKDRIQYKYEMTDKEMPDFHEFSESFFPVLEQKSNKEKDMFGFNIALERYRNSTLDMVEDGRNLMTAVIGLEALFSSKHELGEIKYRISNRVAKLLSNFGFDVREIRKIIEDAYGYRNTIGHGSNIAQSEYQKARDTLDKVCDILRISIIIFGVGLMNLKKNQIVFGIDDSMLGIQNKEYEQIISTVKKTVPKSVIQTKFKK